MKLTTDNVDQIFSRTGECIPQAMEALADMLPSVAALIFQDGPTFADDEPTGNEISVVKRQHDGGAILLNLCFHL
ncbi:hypothetical protein [Tardiphaga robiniae]|uniref:hypothetical protein n=1 Tax=Tardiphaga robiniae TaxID=943830 RepID=UPI0011127094|nr:hypothetical protein [Tardiphaga robiniae]